jgi:hypothetical protein
VAEVDDLGPLRLEDAAHHVDGGVVPVEQARSRDQTDRVDGLVQGRLTRHVFVHLCGSSFASHARQSSWISEFPSTESQQPD